MRALTHGAIVATIILCATVAHALGATTGSDAGIEIRQATPAPATYHEIVLNERVRAFSAQKMIPIPVVREAVAASPWGSLSVYSQERIIRIMTCEAPAYDDAGEVIGVDASLVGDHGLAYGPLQIRVDYHPDLIARYDVFDLDQALQAGWEIFEAGGWNQWSCSTNA